jgi:hypothetical protein
MALTWVPGWASNCNLTELKAKCKENLHLRLDFNPLLPYHPMRGQAMHTNGKHTAEETVRLTPEQNEMVREAIEAKEQGEPTYSAEEVLAYARAKVRAWLPSQSA